MKVVPLKRDANRELHLFLTVRVCEPRAGWPLSGMLVQQ